MATKDGSEAALKTNPNNWHRWKNLLPDVGAGLLLCAFLVPAGMAYSTASGLPPVAGLYASIVSLIIYGLLGPSRVLILGPDSALAPLIAAAVVPLSGGDPHRALALAGLLAIFVGVYLVLGYFLKLGFLSNLLSKPIRTGYLAGLAVVVGLSQLAGLLGRSSDGVTEPWNQLTSAIGRVARGDFNMIAALIGGITIVILLVATRLPTNLRLLGILVTVGGSMVASAVFGLNEMLPVVGALPSGLPAPALSGFSWGDVIATAGPAAGIALLAFADTAVLSRSLAQRNGVRVDGGKEMLALGSANAASGVLGGFPISASTSRTPVALNAGARSRLAGLAAGLWLLVFMLTLPGVTAHLPSSVLSGVVIVAAASMVDIDGIKGLIRSSRIETALMAGTFVGVLVLGVLPGVVLAVVLSLAVFVQATFSPYRTELVKVAGRPGFHDITRHPEGRRIPGLALVRFDSPLFFANGQVFVDHVRDIVDASPQPVRCVIVAAEGITGVDSTAVEHLVQLDEYLEKKGISLVFAELKGPVKDRLAKFGLADRFDRGHHFSTVESAVEHFSGQS
ncbi:SulP family inorganic anion transporter [Arthrobacter sp. ISL-30]|uniref:SulP family inorganic anion transporter n=1 Tax=Arthrobacter sp. ISL-30 TaxID=2819109 RepID=UPI001BEC2085|nr:SulP family inorganic anion transporter [Arthrobacter sp. ISL-30]MBT2512470.1 SulP family inorganic anion transporter [Arthrobacter sp. ISL-30]